MIPILPESWLVKNTENAFGKSKWWLCPSNICTGKPGGTPINFGYVGQMKLDSLKRPKPEKMASISEEKTKTKNWMVRHTNFD